jgi:hypothetical protein
MEADSSLSLQVMLTRKMQADAGQTACFATPASTECGDTECCWRHDCFDEPSLPQEKS